MRASRIEAICAGTNDARTFRLELLGELRRTVPFTWYAWLLTDPQTGVGCAPLADTFGLAEVDHLARVAEPVTAAIRRCLAETFTAPLEPRPELGSPVVLLLGPDLDVRAQTPATDRYLRLLVPPEGGRSPARGLRRSHRELRPRSTAPTCSAESTATRRGRPECWAASLPATTPGPQPEL